MKLKLPQKDVKHNGRDNEGKKDVNHQQRDDKAEKKHLETAVADFMNKTCGPHPIFGHIPNFRFCVCGEGQHKLVAQLAKRLWNHHGESDELPPSPSFFSKFRLIFTTTLVIDYLLPRVDVPQLWFYSFLVVPFWPRRIDWKKELPPLRLLWSPSTYPSAIRDDTFFWQAFIAIWFALIVLLVVLDGYNNPDAPVDDDDDDEEVEDEEDDDEDDEEEDDDEDDENVILFFLSAVYQLFLVINSLPQLIVAAIQYLFQHPLASISFLFKICMLFLSMMMIIYIVFLCCLHWFCFKCLSII